MIVSTGIAVGVVLFGVATKAQETLAFEVAYNGEPLKFNGDPRNGLPYFNTDAFSLNALGKPGNAPRLSFHGPGALNFDPALLKSFPLEDSRGLQLRTEPFNSFNHARFLGPASMDGVVKDTNFGQVLSAASPRLLQAAVKLHF